MAVLPLQAMRPGLPGQIQPGFGPLPGHGAHMSPPPQPQEPLTLPSQSDTLPSESYKGLEAAQKMAPESSPPPRLCKKSEDGQIMQTWDVHVEISNSDGKLEEVAFAASPAAETAQTLIANGLLPHMIAVFNSKSTFKITDLQGVEILQYKNGSIYIKYKGNKIQITDALTLKGREITTINTFLGHDLKNNTVKSVYEKMIESAKNYKGTLTSSAAGRKINPSPINFNYGLSSEQREAIKGQKLIEKDEEIDEAQPAQAQELEKENHENLTRSEAYLPNIPSLRHSGTVGNQEHPDCSAQWEEYLFHGSLLITDDNKKEEVTLAETSNRDAAVQYLNTLVQLADQTKPKSIFSKKPDIQTLISNAFEKEKARLFFKRLLNLLRKQKAEDAANETDFNLYTYISAIHSLLNGGGDGNFETEASDLSSELTSILEVINRQITGLERAAETILNADAIAEAASTE